LLLSYLNSYKKDFFKM